VEVVVALALLATLVAFTASAFLSLERLQRQTRQRAASIANLDAYLQASNAELANVPQCFEIDVRSEETVVPVCVDTELRCALDAEALRCDGGPWVLRTVRPTGGAKRPVIVTVRRDPRP